MILVSSLLQFNAQSVLSSCI